MSIPSPSIPSPNPLIVHRPPPSAPTTRPGVLLAGPAMNGTGLIRGCDIMEEALSFAATGSLLGAPAGWRQQDVSYQLPSQLLNQGSTSSCVGHAWAHFLMAAPSMSSEAETDAIAIWSFSKAHDGFPDPTADRGSSATAGFQDLRDRGLVDGDCGWTQDVGHVLQFLHARGPVVAATRLYKGMLEPVNGVMQATGGFLTDAAGNAGGHAYLIFGFDARRDAFLVANSWGPLWGMGGKAYLPYNVLESLLDQDAVWSAVQT